NLLALNAVMAEWGRTDLNYGGRVNHLNGSVAGGLNGGTYLNAGTVHDDQTVDYLYGNASVLDWFLANSSGVGPDQVNGVRSGPAARAARRRTASRARPRGGCSRRSGRRSSAGGLPPCCPRSAAGRSSRRRPSRCRGSPSR